MARGDEPPWLEGMSLHGYRDEPPWRHCEPVGLEDEPPWLQGELTASK